LGESVEIDCDVDQLLENKEIDAYIGPFLQGYTVKNAINFDDWMIGFREHCRERFTEYAYETVETDRQDFNHLIQTMQVVIKVDPYDERAYRLIMDAYARSGHVNKSFKIFQSLKNILNEDLGVEPDLETKSLFEKLAVQREEESTPRQPANMYGRKQELEILNRGLRNYTADISYKSILIEGEAGIGKTTLLENFLESQVLGGDSDSLKRPIVLSTICYQSEAAFYLKPWHAILEQIIDLTNAHDIFWPVQWRRELLRIFPSLADRLVIDEMDIEQSISLSPTLQVHLLEDIISQLLGLITSKFKILITVDDLQWMDEMSLAILTSQMLQYGRDKLMFIGLKLFLLS
jgi:hypothetical protein